MTLKSTSMSYEEQRQERIAANRAVLQELGLLNNPLVSEDQSLQKQQKPKKKKPRTADQAVEGSRRSARLQGAPAPVHQYNFEAEEKQANKPKRMLPVVPQVTENLDLDSHNFYRISYMSDQALQRRIWRIKNVNKLHSFIKVLEAVGKGEMAAEARQALDQLCDQPTI